MWAAISRRSSSSPGFDALEIQGKAAGDVVIFIDGDSGRVTVEPYSFEAEDSHLIGNILTAKYGGDEKGKRGIAVLSAGQAAEHTRIALINSTWYDVRRKEARFKQAGRGGAGRVFRDKKIAAIVCRFTDMGGDKNGVADMALIRKAGQRINKEITDLDNSQNQMRKIGTANIVDVMDHFDLLPTHNFRFGSHPETHKIDSKIWKEKFTQGLPDGCWLGCTMSCSHGVDQFPLQTGPYAGTCVLVDGPEYENAAGLGSNIGNFDAQKVLELNFYCDTYGIDTISVCELYRLCDGMLRRRSHHQGTHRRTGTELRQRRGGARVDPPNGARRGIRRHRRSGRALHEGILRARIRRRTRSSCTTSAWRSRAWRSPST